MSTLNKYLATFNWLTLNELYNKDHLLVNSALAYQDSLVRYVVEANEQKNSKELPVGVLHFYSTQEPSIYLGAKDTRLKRFEQATEYLKDNHYRLAQRPHGGLAVISDPGISNVSLVTDTNYFSLSIDEGFQMMVDLVSVLFERHGLKVESYEIEDSYCPGKYDIVVNNLKIGGIAQRRFKSGVAIAAYLSINGNQAERGNLIQIFYRIGEADSSYPDVNPDSMTTVSDLMNRDIQVSDFENEVLNYFKAHTSLAPLYYEDPQLQLIYQDMLEKQYQRSYKFNLS